MHSRTLQNNVLFRINGASLSVRPWARCAGSRNSSSTSLRRRVAAVTSVAAVHRDRPITWLRCVGLVWLKISHGLTDEKNFHRVI